MRMNNGQQSITVISGGSCEDGALTARKYELISLDDVAFSSAAESRREKFPTRQTKYGLVTVM